MEKSGYTISNLTIITDDRPIMEISLDLLLFQVTFSFGAY